MIALAQVVPRFTCRPSRNGVSEMSFVGRDVCRSTAHCPMLFCAIRSSATARRVVGSSPTEESFFQFALEFRRGSHNLDIAKICFRRAGDVVAVSSRNDFPNEHPKANTIDHVGGAKASC